MSEDNNAEKVLSILNEVNDNLWLGDLLAAKEAINSLPLEMIREGPEVKAFEQVTRAYKELKEKLKEQYKKKEELEIALSDEFVKELERRNISVEKAVLGALLFRLSKILGQLAEEGESYKTITKPIIKKDHYKYTILDYAAKYEIRALLFSMEYNPNFKKLVQTLTENDFQVSDPIMIEHYFYVKVFSSNVYLEVSILLPRVLMILSLRNPDIEYVESLAEMLLNALIK